MRLIAFRIGLCLLLGLALGCSQTSPTNSAPCACDEECGTGELCDLNSARCLPRVESTTTRGLEVRSPNQDAEVQEFPDPKSDAMGRLVVQLKASVLFAGEVYAGDDLVHTIPAQVVAWRDSLLEGRPRVQVVDSTGSGKEEGYALWLIEGQSYTFSITPLPPLDAEYPPLIETGITVTTRQNKRSFVLDGHERAVVVKGRIVDYVGQPLSTPKNLISEHGDQLSSSVSIRATEVNGLKRSTTGTSDPNTGEFSFKVPAGAARYAVRLETSAGSMPVPSLECTNLELGSPTATVNGGRPPTQELKDIRLPSFRIPQLFTIVVTGADSEAVAGATVTFNTTVNVVPTDSGFDQCTAAYERTGITDAQGRVQLLLIPGSAKSNQLYTVKVVSPAAGKWASRLIGALEVGPSGGTLADIRLAPRYRLSGKIIREDSGTVVPQVVLEAHAIDSGTGQVLGNTSAVSDTLGHYELYLDPGAYTLDFRPPQDLGLPAFGTMIRMERDVDGKVFQIPRPRLATGKVLDADGGDLPLAQVEAYDLVPEVTKPLRHRAALRASAATDQQGAFNLVLSDVTSP